MQTPEQHADPTRQRHLPHDPFEGAHRVVLQQAETFTAPTTFVLPPFDRLDPEVSPGPVEHTRATSDYYDTSELALVRAGITVRRGRDDGMWTVTTADFSGAGEPIRREICYPASASVPGEVRTLLTPQLHGTRMSTIAQLSTWRAVIPLVNRSGVRIADVVDERTVVTRDTGTSAQFRVIDVQVRDLDGVGHRLLDEVHRVLTDAGCIREARISAYARAFGADAFSA